MLIDWFTVIAQIVNFLILIALLKHFLYDRILQAMDEREEKVRSRLEEAEEKEKASEKAAESYRQKEREVEEKREEMLSRAREEAEDRRQELTKKAREDVERLRSGWQEALQNEKEAFLRDLREMTGRQVYHITRRALKDLAGAGLEERIMDMFVDRFREMKTEDIRELAEAITTGDNRAVIRSAFEVPTGMRQKMTRALHEYVADGVEVHYTTDEKMISGIEMHAGGKKIAWSLENYIASLEDRTLDILAKEVRRAEGSGEKEKAEEDH